MVPNNKSGIALIPGALSQLTESQNHRMVGVGRDLCGSSSPTLLMKQGQSSCTRLPRAEEPRHQAVGQDGGPSTPIVPASLAL